MIKAGGRGGKRRPWASTLARTALVALLLPQMAALWILHRPAPTRLPAGLVAAIADGLLGEATAKVERASVDSRGVFRLEGLRVEHADSGLAFVGDARVMPPWQAWMSGGTDYPSVEARGRLMGLADGATLASDLVLRAGNPEGAWFDLAARVGEARIRVESRLMSFLPAPTTSNARKATTLDWRPLLRDLPRLEGGAELRISHGGWEAELALRGIHPGAGPWKVGTLEGRVLDDMGELWGILRATGVGRGELEAGVLRAGVMPGRLMVAFENSRWGRLEGVGGAGILRWRGNHGSLDLGLTAGDSRLRVRLDDPHGPEGWKVERVDMVARATELLRTPGVAELLRQAEIDLSGGIELGDVSIELRDGTVSAAEGWVAVRDAGWKDIRPSVIRPSRPAAAFSGRFKLDLAQGNFAATSLDLAGLVGSISGGLAAGDPYEVRLASTEGNPVHPACLDSLLGSWWLDLWSRFDLSTTGTYPHADVVVRGKWGASFADRVDVAANLERFGFMGARFTRTDVRVTSTPERTQVLIDRLEGEHEGKPAGSAKGTATWDWASGRAAPLIKAEGDLHPLVALKLHHEGADLTARLRGAQFGESWLKVVIDPEGAAAVDLTTRGRSEILGACLGPLALHIAHKERTTLRGTVELAGGKVQLEVEGDPAGRCQVREFQAEGIRWALLPGALPFLFKEPTRDSTSSGLLSGSFRGGLDLDETPDITGEGQFVFKDPQLRRVRLFGVLSQGLDAVGLGFSGYDLTEASGVFQIKDQRATLPLLKIGGEDAELRLAGQVDLNSGRLNLMGAFELKDSPWGPLGFLNPNRLITKVIKVKVVGTLADPETKVSAGF